MSDRATDLTKVQLQFHAESQELIVLAVDWARQGRLTLVAEQFSPEYRAVSVDEPTLERVNTALQQVDRLALCPEKPDLTASSGWEFVTRNPGCLFSIARQHWRRWTARSSDWGHD